MALRNDCFALPPGVEWTPVKEALSLLRDRIEPVAGTEEVSLTSALGRILAEDAAALSSTPPHDNAAVDGYALANASLIDKDTQVLRLLPGRAAAGAPFQGQVPKGAAVRILTGAVMPEGTDCVVMQEDVDLGDGTISFGSGLKQGANRRKSGEDLAIGDAALERGRMLTPVDLAQAASVGRATLRVRKRLRVAVLSTGDELRETGCALEPGAIFDANRPMLSALVASQGFETVDLGIVSDTAEAVRTALKRGAVEADAVLTSGGASGGDEDHVARELQNMGAMALWRIAMKPGRPLALGQIGGVPVFGLPGNPVAAFVCFLLFARPALVRLAGAGWPEPQRFPVTATFSAKKKPGRTEYLRGRYAGGGRAEKFRSEGSGLISGLRWSNGLIALDHDRGPVAEGETVDFIPYRAFGL